jgi:hypothetical protein
MEVGQELTGKIQKAVGPLVGSAVAAMAMAAGVALIEKLLVTNVHESNLTGDKELHPTNDEASLSKVETSAKDTDASLAKDEATAKDGDLSAMRTDAAASNGEATALDGGATAARTKAGAADIETKALKMT